MKNQQFTKYDDDGFGITAAEPWFIQKAQIIQDYLTAFVTNLAGKVDEIIFVDLFAGGGLYSLGTKREIFAGTPLQALAQNLPIQRYVFCERDADQFKALKIRVNKYYRGKNVILLDGKPEELIDKLKLYIPVSKGNFRAAVFCVCDPFSLDIPFDTVEKLSNLGFNFLMPFTFALNQRLNYRYYLKEDKEKLRRYLGGNKDMERLAKGIESNAQFYKRLIQIYENNLLASGLNASTSVHKLDSGLMEMPVYYMGLFSRQYSTKAIQQDVEATHKIQIELFS